jgi:hypothetical protein
MFTVEHTHAASQAHNSTEFRALCHAPKPENLEVPRGQRVGALVAQGSSHLCHPTAVGSCNDSQSSCTRGKAENPRFGRPGPDEDQPGQVASKVTWTGLQRLIFPHWTLVFDAQKRRKDGRASDR